MENNDANSIANYIKNEMMVGSSPNVKIKDESFIYEILKDRGEWNSIRRVVRRKWKVFCKKKTLRRFIIFLCRIRCAILKSVKVNFIRLFATFVICVTALTIGIIFFINGILFYKNYNEIYKEGTIVTRQSLNREHMMFLFSASNLWANTGIKIMKGDLVKISASGAFNSSVSDIIKGSKKNQILQRKWTNIVNKPINTSKEPPILTIYNGEDSYFGSLLMQVQPEVNDCLNNQKSNGEPIFKLGNNQNIWQITENMINKYFYVNKTGNIYFAINDIYLSDEIIHRYCNDTSLIEKAKDLYYITPQKDSVFANKKNKLIMQDHFSQIRDCWFNDNVGEVLVCIEIVRGKGNVMGWFNYISIWFIRVLDKYYLYFIGTILLSFILFIFVKLKHHKK